MPKKPARPPQGHAYVKRIVVAKTKSKIILLEDHLAETLRAEDCVYRGEVLAVAPGAAVQRGDVVRFGQIGTSEVNLGGNRGWCFVVAFADILGVEEP